MRTVPNFSASADHTPTPRSDNDRALSVLLLAAAVAALAVTVNQLMDTWAEDQLLTAWVALWAVVFAGSLLLAGTARRMAQHLVAAVTQWQQPEGVAQDHHHIMDSQGRIALEDRNVPHYI